jgi:hypothetical protein
VQPAEPGDTRDVHEHVCIVGSLGQRHATQPRAPAVVGTNVERRLGLDEARQRVTIEVVDALRTRNASRLLR